MAEVDFGKHVDNATEIIGGIITIALMGGIGSYILYTFSQNVNGSSQWFNLLDNQVTLVQTLVTILIIGAVALVGFGVVNIIRKRGE